MCAVSARAHSAGAHEADAEAERAENEGQFVPRSHLNSQIAMHNIKSISSAHSGMMLTRLHPVDAISCPDTRAGGARATCSKAQNGTIKRCTACKHTYIHTHTYIHIFAYFHTHTFTHPYPCSRLLLPPEPHASLRIHTSTPIPTSHRPFGSPEVPRLHHHPPTQQPGV